ncbi:methylamine utilization protein MauE [Novosphingobium sp. 1Y9A]|uniref:Methylamine utilization protein MauE n=1 Tax=Novosphingobium jiangmenense TaxID=2791981 RepID=A0ABS0HH04_9SPHN|nr:MauE/DoxX family redox-associated membrane protein [Novosphingobium jiangmenense]MBF9151496.1 methylamine utilization protein MauE [Novosphingobium jiangmenense]
MGEAIGVAGAAAGIGVGAVFLGAGLAKLRNRRVFPGVVANYRLLPEPLVAPVAVTLPIAEVVIGLALFAGLRVAAVPAGLLLLAFAAAMAINIGRGRSHIDCGCGRPELRQPLSRALVVRNLVLAALLLPLLMPTPPVGSALWFVALAFGVALYLLTLLANALSALAQGPLAMERNSR